MQALADDASENLEAMVPPLFLRFLNLLMNDAIFLLDEAIQVNHYLRGGRRKWVNTVTPNFVRLSFKERFFKGLPVLAS